MSAYDTMYVISESADTTTEDIPQYDINNLARAVLRAVKKAFQDPQIQAEFEEWKRKKAAERGAAE